MVVFKRKCFTEVRIRKKVDNHRQGLWREYLVGEKAGWMLFNLMWSPGLRGKIKCDCGRVFEKT